MQLTQAIQFIQPAIPQQKGVWADIGAGSGIFTQALDQLLAKDSSIYALDTNIHSLNNLILENAELQVVQQDFNQRMDLPNLDGIIMANALHYSSNPIETLKPIIQFLKPNGLFILMEYELNMPRPPWIPYPIPFDKFKKIAAQLPVSSPVELNRIQSTFGNNYIYLAKIQKLAVD